MTGFKLNLFLLKQINKFLNKKEQANHWPVPYKNLKPVFNFYLITIRSVINKSPF